MKIYFAGSITGGKADAGLYVDLINYLKEFGQVLTEHIADGNLTDAGEQLDVVEIFKNRFMPTINLKKINISTEELTSEDGSKSKVSAIEIIIAK
jgi:DNA-binding protein Alba